MRRTVLLSALTLTLVASAPAHAAKAGTIAQIRARCQAQWTALTTSERNTWTAATYLTACVAGKPVPVHGGPTIKP